MVLNTRDVEMPHKLSHVAAVPGSERLRVGGTEGGTWKLSDLCSSFLENEARNFLF